MRNENEIATIIVDVCFKTHDKYGPGLFESFYERVICHDLIKHGIAFERQKAMRVFHDGADMGIAFIADLVVENKVIVELKSVENIAEVHHKQLLTYLKVSNLKLGLLINFNVRLFKNGIHRKVNNL